MIWLKWMTAIVSPCGSGLAITAAGRGRGSSGVEHTRHAPDDAGVARGGGLLLIERRDEGREAKLPFRHGAL